MSGHSKWAKIKHKKAVTDAKRGAAFTKIIREITAAAKDGGGNTDHNPRLRTAISRAREINMANSNIENAIKKGTGELPGVIYETVVFDAFGPGGVALLIKGLTDNKNRTTAEIRNILSKKNGSLAGAGSTAWMFTQRGLISIEKTKVGEEELMGIALDAGAEDFNAEDASDYEIICDPATFESVKNAIEVKRIPMVMAEITMIASSKVKVEGEQARQLVSLIETLEEHEDVQAVSDNSDISEKDLEQGGQ